MKPLGRDDLKDHEIHLVEQLAELLATGFGAVCDGEFLSMIGSAFTAGMTVAVYRDEYQSLAERGQIVCSLIDDDKIAELN